MTLILMSSATFIVLATHCAGPPNICALIAVSGPSAETWSPRSSTGETIGAPSGMIDSDFASPNLGKAFPDLDFTSPNLGKPFPDLDFTSPNLGKPFPDLDFASPNLGKP